MNNIEQIDYAISDWIDDNDVCISRRSSEFPRMTPTFTSHLSPIKPWGEVSDPVHIDILDHPFFNISHFRPGVWYYGGIGGTDHLDLCGFSEFLSPLRTLLGSEFRFDTWRVLFIRLKML